jgi:phosphohistidine phosphatase SixA
LTSPYARAQETASILCSIFPDKTPVVRTPLAAGASISALRAEVVGEKDQPSLLIIGHMPDLAQFASGIVGDPWLMEEGHMDPGAVWALDPGDLASGWGKGKFLWRRNLEDWNQV